jgi:RND family efflux transporter MFP subunit
MGRRKWIFCVAREKFFRFDSFSFKANARGTVTASDNRGDKVRKLAANAAKPLASCLWIAVALSVIFSLASCTGTQSAETQIAPTVGVTKVTRKSLQRQITLSSELVPFQEIDVYAKESGFVQKLYVDYGTRVKKGQLMATLEIPELQALLVEDKADIKADNNEVSRDQNEVGRYKAEYKALHLEYTRLNDVSQSQPGLVAQQEVDDAQGKDLAASSQVDAAEAALDAARSQLASAQAKLAHDQALFDYSRITAPFAGVVTNRYANLGTLMQAGTDSSTQALPLVRLSEDDLFRLVIPVPESYVEYIRIGDPVEVSVPSLNRTFPGKVARFSVEVREDTRTMHTEVDIPNPERVLMPGLFAEATLTLQKKDNILTVPVQAVSHENNQTAVYMVNAQDQIAIQPVTAGMQTTNNVEILSGVSEGEQVVVSDRSGLKAGEKVQPHLEQVMQFQNGEVSQQ